MLISLATIIISLCLCVSNHHISFHHTVFFLSIPLKGYTYIGSVWPFRMEYKPQG